MDTSASDLIRKFIDESLKQSPYNPQANGFGLAMGTMAGLCILLLVVVWFLYRDQKRERRRLEADTKQARKDAGSQIDGRFDKVEGIINTGLDEIEKKVDDGIGDLQGKYASLREELTKVKMTLDFIQKTR